MVGVTLLKTVLSVSAGDRVEDMDTDEVRLDKRTAMTTTMIAMSPSPPM